MTDARFERALRKSLKQQQHICSGCGTSNRTNAFSKKQVQALETEQLRVLREAVQKDLKLKIGINNGNAPCIGTIPRNHLQRLLCDAAHNFYLHNQPLVCKNCQRLKRQNNSQLKADKLKEIRNRAQPMSKDESNAASKNTDTDIQSGNSQLLVVDEDVPPPKPIGQRFPGAVLLRDIKELDKNDAHMGRNYLSNGTDSACIGDTAVSISKEIEWMLSAAKDCSLGPQGHGYCHLFTDPEFESDLAEAVQGARVVLILGERGTTLPNKLMRQRTSVPCTSFWLHQHAF